jgi:hypothetical protein
MLSCTISVRPAINATTAGSPTETKSEKATKTSRISTPILALIKSGFILNSISPKPLKYINAQSTVGVKLMTSKHTPASVAFSKLRNVPPSYLPSPSLW